MSNHKNRDYDTDMRKDMVSIDKDRTYSPDFTEWICGNFEVGNRIHVFTFSWNEVQKVLPDLATSFPDYKKSMYKLFRMMVDLGRIPTDSQLIRVSLNNNTMGINLWVSSAEFPETELHQVIPSTYIDIVRLKWLKENKA